jgi:putative Holliday junction resolvase
VTRLLGIDLGDRRIGLAVADVPDGPATPYRTIARATTVEEDAETLRAIVAGESIDEVILGLPLHFGGSEGHQAAVTRAWGEAMGAVLGVPIHLRDERLTSERAADHIGPMKRGRSGGPPTTTQRRAYRARLDREAAAMILRDELEARAGRDE